MYVAQADSGASTGHVYVYNSIARVLPIPNQEGFTGEMWRFDLAPFLANSITVSFKSGTSPPAWLDLTSNVLSGTLPAVSRAAQDDNYNIQLTATHVDRVHDFTVTLTVKYIETARWDSIPTVTLDQAVTPNIPSPNPQLVTTATLHLTDHISNLSRAGTLAFSFENSEGIVGASLTSRTVDGETILDVLTLTAPSTLPVENSPVASVNLLLRATNAVGRGDLNLAVDITHLQLPRLQRLPSQSINRDEIDSLNLASFATGRPTVFFALGTITPRLDESVATIISNANGRWSIHPNAALETTNTYTVNVIASNRVGTARGSFQMTIHGVPHVDPPIAPVWKTGTDIQFQIDSGATQRIDLSTLIARARPQPTFSLGDGRQIQDIGGTASIVGNFLTVSIPAGVDEALNRDLPVIARNTGGASEIELRFMIMPLVAPVWGAVPRQSADIGRTYTIDLNAYVTGDPTPSITFQPGQPDPNAVNGDATIENGILTWMVPVLTMSEVVEFRLQATNTGGTTNYSLGLHVDLDVAPEWVDRQVFLYAREGVREVRLELAVYLTAGMPVPTLVLSSDVVSVPAALAFVGTELIIQDVADVAIETQFDFSIVARNRVGAAAKQFTLIIQPSLDMGDVEAFTTTDYAQVRSLLDSRLTQIELPDGVIAQDVFIRAAVDWAHQVMPIDPSNPRDDAQLRRKKRATLYYCAGILSGSVRRIVETEAASVSSTFSEISWEDLQTQLFARAREEALLADPVGPVASQALGSGLFEVEEC